MSGSKKHSEDGAEEKKAEMELTADELKLIKQFESGKDLDEKAVKDAIQITDKKYEWFISNMYDIDPVLGLVWKDYEQVSKQRKVVFFLLKQIGSNLFKGKSVMNIAFPVTIMDHETVLERIAKTYIHLPAFAEKLVKEKDPVEKMKIFSSYAISCIYPSVKQPKPFNAPTGETLQGYLGTPEYTINCEQLSYSPSQTAVYIDCPWCTISTIRRFDISTYPNSAKGTTGGRQIIKLKDEKNTTYLIKRIPEGVVGGLLVGKRTMTHEGYLDIKDITNKIYAQVRFNPEKQGFFEKLFNKTKATRSDFFKGFITRNKALLKDESRKAFYSKDMICYLEGQWLEYLIIDGDFYWQLGREMPSKLITVPDPLPSDSTFRSDLRLLNENKLDEAQKAMEDIEELQRKDQKLRADGEKIAKANKK